MAKFDGVIVAVRYKGSKIEMVRVFERRGPTFSDRILLDRATLLERLKQGKRFVTGQRREFLASTFDVGKPVNLAGQNGNQIVSTLPHNGQDHLEGVPRF